MIESSGNIAIFPFFKSWKLLSLLNFEWDLKFYFLHMKSNKVGTTLKHPETINGNVKNLSKRMEMKDKGECHFYFKNLTLPFNTRVGTFLNSTSKAKLPFSAHQNTSFPPPLQFSKFFKTYDFLPMTRDFLAIFSKKSP